MGEFKKIEQKGTIDEYLEKFEDLKAWVLIRNPTIPEEFFLEFFVEGLKEEIRHTEKMLNPFSLSQTVDKAINQENLLNALSRKEKGQWGKATTSSYHQNTNVNTKGVGLSMGNAWNRLFETKRA